VDLTLSKRGDYVVRSAICLACAYGSGEPKKRNQVAAEMGVPRTFVSQILGDLVHAGLAVSSFGKNGGYRLARAPAEVTLLEVVEAGEGPLAPARCALGDGPCRWEAVCPLHESWGGGGGGWVGGGGGGGGRGTVSLVGADWPATSLADVAERSRAIEAGTYPVPADAHRRAAPTVHVADSVQIELAAPAVAARLRAGGSWLASHVEAASADGEATRMRVGPGGPAWLGKIVAVRLGAPHGSDGALAIPLTWEATGPTGLFPRLEAELRLSALDPERAELALEGRYRPPLGRAGQVLDERLLAHVATATVRSFLRRVARALDEVPPASQPRSRAGQAGSAPVELAAARHAGGEK
jgi:Rrf2 family protein